MNTAEITARAPRTLDQTTAALYRCPACAMYHHGMHAVEGVEEHHLAHRLESTKALREIFATGDFARFFRAVKKANALRAEFGGNLWSYAMTLALPAEHTERQRADALERIPGLLDSLERDDYRHARSRGLIHPVQRFG